MAKKTPKKKPGKKWGRKAENWEIGDKSGTSRNGEMKGKWDLRGEPQKWGFLCQKLDKKHRKVQEIHPKMGWKKGNKKGGKGAQREQWGNGGKPG